MAGPRHVRPLSKIEAASGVGGLDDVRLAIATGDRRGALGLLRAHVVGQIDLSSVPAIVADALVATARGSDRAAHAHSQQQSGGGAQEVRAQIIEQLTQTPFTTNDLAEIRNVLDSLERRIREAEERARREDLRFEAPGERQGRHIGSVWLELKNIPDPDSGRVYGPYLYGRWREAGRKRSRYIGKP